MRGVRLGFIASVEGLLLGCLGLLVLLLCCLCCFVSVKSFLASHFIWVSFSAVWYCALWHFPFYKIQFNSPPPPPPPYTAEREYARADELRFAFVALYAACGRGGEVGDTCVRSLVCGVWKRWRSGRHSLRVVSLLFLSVSINTHIQPTGRCRKREPAVGKENQIPRRAVEKRTRCRKREPDPQFVFLYACVWGGGTSAVCPY